MPFGLGFAQHVAHPPSQSAEERRLGRRIGIVGLVVLEVRLVLVAADRDQVDLHATECDDGRRVQVAAYRPGGAAGLAIRRGDRDSPVGTAGRPPCSHAPVMKAAVALVASAMR